MTTELSTITNPGSTDLTGASSTIVSLQEWAAELSAATALGRALALTEFVPLSLKTLAGGRPKEPQQIAENVAACILAGKSLNIDPMTALQNIFVVHGRPGMYARTMVALILRAGHSVYQVESTEQRVVWEGYRADSPDRKIRAEWTIARAQKAGYTSNKKYQTDPIAMLTAKCQAEISRLVGPDVLTGIASNSVEETELEDLGETPAPQGAETPAPSTGKRTVQRGRQAAPAPATPKGKAPEPEADPEIVEDEPSAEAGQHFDEAREAANAVNTETGEIPEPAEESHGVMVIDPESGERAEISSVTDDPLPKMASRLQRGKLTNALKPTCSGPEEALARISDWLGRPIGSTEEMTEAECVRMTEEVLATGAGQ